MASSPGSGSREPPVAEVIDVTIELFGRHKLLSAVQVYDINAGQNHGLLLATRRWAAA
jgi:hypothetical protein